MHTISMHERAQLNEVCPGELCSRSLNVSVAILKLMSWDALLKKTKAGQLAELLASYIDSLHLWRNR